MKQTLPKVLFALLVILSFLSFGCKKGITDPVTLDKAAGKWSINAIRYQYFIAGNLVKDSTTPWQPVVENFANFDGRSTIKYCFNTSYVTTGQYSMLPNDSIYIKMGSEDFKWKILLLTGTNFNIARTISNYNDDPSATCIMYKSFVR